MSVSKHCLLTGWCPRGLIVYHLRFWSNDCRVVCDKSISFQVSLYRLIESKALIYYRLSRQNISSQLHFILVTFIRIWSKYFHVLLYILGILANVVFSQCSNSFCGNEIFLEMRNTLFSLYKQLLLHSIPFLTAIWTFSNLNHYCSQIS